MPAVYDHHLTVAAGEIDPQGHANNVAYVQWMQDAAVAHSTAQGWPGLRVREAGYSWVARSHWIEYRRPAFEGDEVVIRTWVANMQRVSSLRCFEILRRNGEERLAVAETNWAFVTVSDGRLARVPAELAGAFEIVDRRWTVDKRW